MMGVEQYEDEKNWTTTARRDYGENWSTENTENTEIDLFCPQITQICAEFLIVHGRVGVDCLLGSLGCVGGLELERDSSTRNLNQDCTTIVRREWSCGSSLYVCVEFLFCQWSEEVCCGVLFWAPIYINEVPISNRIDSSLDQIYDSGFHMECRSRCL